MNKTLTLLIFIISFAASSQNKKEYLENNRFDIEHGKFKFPQTNFNIIGFGAYQGVPKRMTRNWLS